MRVLHLLDHSLPLHSGYTFRTAAILREQRRIGWQTFHLTSPKQGACGGAEEETDGLRFARTNWSPAGAAAWPVVREFALMNATAGRLRELVRAVRPDLIHAHSPVLNALPAIRVGREFAIPVVYEVRAFWEDAAVDHGTSREWGLRYRASRWLETQALRRAAHVTTICEGLKRDIVGRGVPPQRITVIPNAVDVGAFAFEVARDLALARQLGLEGCTVVGFVGSFYAYEGLDLLVEAVARLRQRRTDVRLLLVGGGPQEDALRLQVRQAGLAESVVFTGRVPHGQVPRYYSLIDVLAYPRKSMRLTELVTPLKPLEAMAQGQLLVASDVGGHRELIRDGETGFLFRAGDPAALVRALERMLDSRERWPRIRLAGRRYVESERNWAASVAGYRDVYGRLLQPGSAQPCRA
jgi:glycogen(starch) synthase